MTAQETQTMTNERTAHEDEGSWDYNSPSPSEMLAKARTNDEAKGLRRIAQQLLVDGYHWNDVRRDGVFVVVGEGAKERRAGPFSSEQNATVHAYVTILAMIDVAGRCKAATQAQRLGL